MYIINKTLVIVTCDLYKKYRCAHFPRTRPIFGLDKFTNAKAPLRKLWLVVVKTFVCNAVWCHSTLWIDLPCLAIKPFGPF